MGFSCRTQLHPLPLLMIVGDSLADPSVVYANTGSGPREISLLPRVRASPFKNETQNETKKRS